MDDTKRYHAALHAVQSGIAAKMNYDNKDVSPKHLRVGVNSLFVNDAALVNLLVKKGLFTMEEYTRELADEMEREQDRYEKDLTGILNRPIKLG